MPSFAAPLSHVSHSLDRLHQRPENGRRDSSLLSIASGSNNHHAHAPSVPHYPDERSSSRQRSRSPSKISHKGHLKLHVAETVVLVHPPETKLEVLGEGIVNQVSQPQEDTVLNGQIEVIMDKPRVARSIRVELVVTCRLQIPGENNSPWHDREIFSRCVEIGNVDDEEDESQGIKLEKGSQRFEFSIIVPATLATYDRHPLGRIVPFLRATVEGFPVQTSHHHHPSFNLFSGMGMGMGIGKQRDSRSRNRSRPSSRPSSRAPSPNRIPRNGSSTHLPRNPSSSNLMNNLPRTGSTSHFRQDLFDASTWTAASTTSSPLNSPGLTDPPEFETGDVAFPLPTPTELKPLKGQLFAEKILVVASNPSSSKDGEGLTSLSLQKTGRLAGVGDWKLSLTSDAVSALERDIPLIECASMLTALGADIHSSRWDRMSLSGSSFSHHHRSPRSLQSDCFSTRLIA